MPPETSPETNNAPEQTEFDFDSQVEAQAPAATSPEAEGLPEGKSPPEGTPPAAVPAEPYLTYAGKKFETKDELLAYLAQVDQEKAYRAGIAEALAPPETPPTPEPDPADLIFEDPKKAVELLKKQIKQEFDAAQRIRDEAVAKQNAQKAMWDSFYTQHPDLAGKRELVELIRNQTKSTIGEMPVSQALPALAKETRKYINSLRDNADGGRELSSDPAVTSGTGGVKSTGTTPAARPTTLVDELRAIRNRKSG